MTDTRNNLKEKILGTIESGEVRMRPKLYFVLQVAALAFLALVILVISVFILNFIFFSVRLNHQDMLLSRGPSGWGAFLYFFPWQLLGLDVALILLLETLLRQFRFGYRVPALYLLGGLLFLTILTAAAIDRGTPFNDRLFERRHDLPPPVRVIYIDARHHDVDDTLQGFGIPLPPDMDATGTNVMYRQEFIR